MQGPSDTFRSRVWERAEDIESEDALVKLLDKIDEKMRADLEADLDREIDATEAENQLTAVGSWASVASYAVARVSAPASPWPRNVAGWGTKVAGRLQAIAARLSQVLQPIAKALHAASFSISVSYPWGIQISLTW